MTAGACAAKGASRDAASKNDSGCGGTDRDQAAVELKVLLDHAPGREALASASVGQFGEGAAHGPVLVEVANSLGEAGRVVGTEIQSRVAPNLAEAWDIVGHDRASRKRGLECGHSQRLVTRGGGIDGRAAEEGTELRFRLRSANRDRGLLGINFHVGADRNPGHWDRLL